MKSTNKSLTGKRFFRLLAVREIATRNKKSYWLVKCDCGKEKEVERQNLRSGRTKSCGCWKRQSPELRAIHGACRGGVATKEYQAWAGMKRRCCDSNSSDWSYYGGRGIKVCSSWINSFADFLYDMGPRPKGNSIERINVNGNYEPKNCRWATKLDQANNTRTNRKINSKGETMTLMQWSRRTGLKRETISGRLSRGWPTDLALTMPVSRTNLKTADALLILQYAKLTSV